MADAQTMPSRAVSKKSFWWVKFEPEAWLADTGYLSLAQRGAYISIVSVYYNKRRALSMAKMMQVCGVSREEWESDLWPALSDYFQVGEDGLYHNAKCDVVLTEREEISSVRSDAGKRGASARWDGKRMANASQSDAQLESDLEVDKKERSDPSDQAPSPPKQSSFLPEPEKPKSPYELARGDLLPLLAEMAGYADDANGRMKAGKLFNQIYGQIDKDLDGLREIVTRIHAKAETRDKGIACIKAEIESRKNTVRLVVDNEKPDPWGINAWCIAQGATPTQSAKEKSIGKWALHGRIVDSTARNIAKAAMLPASWRGDWSALAGWVKDKIPTDQIIVAINRRCENPSYDPSMIRSIRFFDDNVRGGRRAA